MPDKPRITWTPRKLRRLKKLTAKARADGKPEFTFEGSPCVTAYAEYLIEYLETPHGCKSFDAE